MPKSMPTVIPFFHLIFNLDSPMSTCNKILRVPSENNHYLSFLSKFKLI